MKKVYEQIISKIAITAEKYPILIIAICAILFIAGFIIQNSLYKLGL